MAWAGNWCYLHVFPASEAPIWPMLGEGNYSIMPLAMLILYRSYAHISLPPPAPLSVSLTELWHFSAPYYSEEFLFLCGIRIPPVTAPSLQESGVFLLIHAPVIIAIQCLVAQGKAVQQCGCRDPSSLNVCTIISPHSHPYITHHAYLKGPGLALQQ